MAAVMKIKEVFAVLDAIIAAQNDVYAKGCYGQKLTKSLLGSKRKQSKSMTAWYDSECPHAPGKTWYEYLLTKLGHQGYDCVCLQKGILWGSRPGTCGKYKANDVPDLSANGWFAKCTEVINDLGKVKPGMVIWFEGHVGLVKDAHTVYETSPKTGKVVLRSIKCQPWKKAGHLPWLDYTAEESCTGATASSSSSSASVELEEGDQVTICAGAEYSGAAKGTPVPSKYTDGDVFTVSDTGAAGALLKELNSWVSMKYLRKVTTKKLTVSGCSALNVRKGPGTGYRVVRVLKAGTVVTGYEKQGNWWCIGTNQWASATYLK